MDEFEFLEYIEENPDQYQHLIDVVITEVQDELAVADQPGGAMSIHEFADNLVTRLHRLRQLGDG